MLIEKETLDQYESRYRARLINSLAGPKQVVLVGTKSADGRSNLAIFNSLIHLGANPPLWGLVFRPDVVQRDTLKNILETGQYTLNYANTGDFEKAHQTSAKYAPDVSEFGVCGFTETYVGDFSAPFVGEALVKIGMVFEQKIDLTINNTLLIIGRIEQIDLNENWVEADGFVHLEQANTLASAGLDAYYKTELIDRLSYASTEKWPEKL
jgi:flavin reductase (DIM6/NTAB) family NADH-FMN oxidoreductase RutF